ncbi:hypothetical protein M9Y10_009045 [Tritrichomonas musculus]|uniref:Sm domain-containing protein n=1 Tax=Tritrichomonas musculus TaxID=1915356 RepID=A0ABR2J1N7_9EUKA
MGQDGTVYEGCLRVCDQSTNLVFYPVNVKTVEDGKVIQKSYDCFFVRGDEVCFIAQDLRSQEHKNPILP